MNKSQYIKIQNFRCFKELEINGFKRVNLIGGKNNAGKTSLLEALLIYFYPNPNSFKQLLKIRKLSSQSITIKKEPKDTWNNFFYSQDIKDSISIHGWFENSGEQRVNISVSQGYNDMNALSFDPISEATSNISLSYFSSTLKIKQELNQEEPIERRLVATHEGLNSDFPDGDNISLVSSSFLISSVKIAQQYDKIDYEGKGGEDILNILKILDPSITGLRTYSFNEPTLYIQTKTQPRGLPISLFGDAVYRVTAIILEILDKKHKVLFIDEIENGIHYASQKSFWEGLFRLSEELDTLIFATTHSLEMIQAFTETGKNFPDQGAYFELAYSPRTDNIVAINRDIDLLEYDLEHGKAIRGE
jgi:AAA15 family ATPase/GTPase